MEQPRLYLSSFSSSPDFQLVLSAFVFVFLHALLCLVHPTFERLPESEIRKFNDL